MEVGCRGNSLDLQLGERSQHATDRLLPRRAVDDQLANHRVVIGGDGIAGVDVRVEPHAHSPWDEDLVDASRSGLEILLWVLGVDPALDRCPLDADVALFPRECFSGRHLNLRFDQIDARHHFADGMLHLDARVHFNEIEMVVPVDDELDRTGVGVSGFLHEPHGGVADLLPDFVGQVGSGALFDKFLVAALRRAVPLPQMDDVAVMVGQDLHFDVPRALDELLDVDALVPECSFGLGLSLRQRGRE